MVRLARHVRQDKRRTPHTPGGTRSFDATFMPPPGAVSEYIFKYLWYKEIRKMVRRAWRGRHCGLLSTPGKKCVAFASVRSRRRHCLVSHGVNGVNGVDVYR